MKAVKSILVFVLLLTAAFKVTAQDNSENWVNLIENSDKILSINIYGLDSFKNDDFYLWIKEKYTAPVQIDGVEKEVSESKTYYLFSKSLKRYSIVEIVYFDGIGNAIANFRYPNNSPIPEYRYSYPIFQNSEMENIFIKCQEYLPKG